MARDDGYIWIERYRNNTKNSSIAASGTALFGNTDTDRANKSKYGSMNTLIISNRSAYPVEIQLDGDPVTQLYPSATFIMDRDEGIYFDIVGVKNLDTGNAIAANLITLRWGRADKIKAK